MHNKIKWKEEENNIMDANDFQIHLKSDELIEEVTSLWENKPELIDYLRQEVRKEKTKE